MSKKTLTRTGLAIVALAAIVMYLQGLVLTRTSAVGSLTAVTAMTLTMLIADRSVPFTILAVAVSALIWLRHISNVKGLMAEAKARKAKRGPITGGMANRHD